MFFKGWQTLINVEVPRLRGPFALVVWKRAAIEHCVGDDRLKEIILYDKDENEITRYPYMEATVENLESQGIPVIDLTKGLDIPQECLEKSKIQIPVGVIWGVSGGAKKWKTKK